MKKLMFIALALAAGISFAADYSPSSLPANTNQPDVMPGMVNFQGLLRDPATGNVYANGLYDLECRIYTSVSSSAKPLWGAKYQAYVRDGYFNIMLGSSANELSGCTYKSTELWKALWYDTQNRELYLGVTPWQRANGTTIEDAKDRVEVLPRQQLLASPFSFRAHKAQYADAATGNFTVKGDLSVDGQILNNGKSFGLKNVTATDEAITVGANTASPDKTTMQGRTVNIESGDGLNLTAGGDATVTTTAGKSLTVGGGGSVAVEVTGNVSAKGKDVTVTANAKAKVVGTTEASLKHSGGDGVTVDKDGVFITSPTYVGYAYNGIRNPPIIFENAIVSLPAGTASVSPLLTSLNLSSIGGNSTLARQYTWAVVGYIAISVTAQNISSMCIALSEHSGSVGWPYLSVMRQGSTSASCTVYVQLMGVWKGLCKDNRQ